MDVHEHDVGTLRYGAYPNGENLSESLSSSST